MNEKNNKLNELENKIKLNEEINNNQINNIINNFKFENMNNIKTLNNNEGSIYCLKILDDGKLAAGDLKSNFIIKKHLNLILLLKII